MSISDKAKALTKSNPNETNEIYNQGFKSGGEHSTPSQETIKLIKSMEEKFDTHLKYIKESLDRNERDHEKLTQTINDFIKGAEDKYACKKTEGEVRGIEVEIKEIKKERERRSYDWLKHGIIVVISTLVSVSLVLFSAGIKN